MDDEIHSALDEMNHDGSVQTGFEIGRIHRYCPEFQAILKDIETLSKLMMEHHATCTCIKR